MDFSEARSPFLWDKCPLVPFLHHTIGHVYLSENMSICFRFVFPPAVEKISVFFLNLESFWKTVCPRFILVLERHEDEVMGIGGVSGLMFYFMLVIFPSFIDK